MTQNNGLFSKILEDWRLGFIVQKIVVPDAQILDIGCGEANIIKKIKNIGNYTGVDLLENAIISNIGKYPEYNFFDGDILKMDFEEKIFDYIIMSAFIEHLEYQQACQMLNKLNCCLNTTGKIIGTTPHINAEGIHNIGSRLGLFSREAADEHKCFYDKEKLTKLAKETGYNLATYQTFQWGLNQLFVFNKNF